MTITGKMIQPAGTVFIDGGRLVIAGDYRMQTVYSDGSTIYSLGYFKMTNPSDYVFVGGNFITQGINEQTGYLTAGVLEVKGNFSQYYVFFTAKISSVTLQFF